MGLDENIPVKLDVTELVDFFKYLNEIISNDGRKSEEGFHPKDPPPGILTSCSSPAPVLNGSVSAISMVFTVQTGTSKVDHYIYEYFVCENQTESFISGRDAVLAQCLNGEWLPHFDWCEIPCPAHRDCSTLLELSKGRSGLYRVIPSGQTTDEPLNVWCEMDDPIGGGTGWTTLFRHVGSQFPETALDYESGFGDAEQTWTLNSTYFAGFFAMADWNYNEDWSTRNLVLQFLLEDIYGFQYHATYSSVAIHPATFSLIDVGQYHGNADVPPPTFTMVSQDPPVSVAAFDEVVTGGPFESSLNCAEYNASLMMIDSLDVLVGMTENMYYYTSHMYR
ncbi:uncharacterized protein [Palaemon carinicauda]|uniref:uncharacterized protein n=1 Tax=Palaemon carinicauda TaxID=392227 RepID=UPI0035B5B00D